MAAVHASQSVRSVSFILLRPITHRERRCSLHYPLPIHTWYCSCVKKSMTNDYTAEILQFIAENTPCSRSKLSIWWKKRARNKQIFNQLIIDDMVWQRDMFGNVSAPIPYPMDKLEDIPSYVTLTAKGFDALAEYNYQKELLEPSKRKESREIQAQKMAKISLFFSIIAVLISFLSMLIDFSK